MKKQIKIGVLAVLLIAGVIFSANAQVPADLKDLQEGVMDFSDNLAKALPFNASLGLNWSDAYIGKVFPSIPPHFGIGGSFGFTTLKLPMIKTLAGYFGYKLPFDMGRMPLPAYTGEGRLGGFFLPFDIGFKFGYLPPIGLWGTNMNMKYLLTGADLRYALLDKPILPKISLGVGVNYMKSGIGGKVGSGTSITYKDGSVDHTISLEHPEVNLEWKTVSLDFKAQLSKSFIIITPYLGVGASYAWSSAGYAVDADITDNGGAVDLTAIKGYLDDLGLKGVDINSNGISSMIKNKAFNARLFGGFAINLMVFRLDFTGLYSFRDGNLGASFGFRFQL